MFDDEISFIVIYIYIYVIRVFQSILRHVMGPLCRRTTYLLLSVLQAKRGRHALRLTRVYYLSKGTQEPIKVVLGWRFSSRSFKLRTSRTGRNVTLSTATFGQWRIWTAYLVFPWNYISQQAIKAATLYGTKNRSDNNTRTDPICRLCTRLDRRLIVSGVGLREHKNESSGSTKTKNKPVHPRT
jgi:hypothetical protein